MIKVYTGPMFAGKTTALIKEYEQIENKKSIIAFKPSKDKRDKTEIRARNIETKIPAIVIDSLDEIPKHIEPNIDNIKYIFIDEVQFLEGDTNLLLMLSIVHDINIIIAGLKQTSELEPFGIMPYILTISDEINVLKAKCECGKEALYTACGVSKTGEILIGDSKEYKAVCKECYKKLFQGVTNEN